MTADSCRTVRLQRARYIAAPIDKLLTAGTGIRHSEKNDQPAVSPDAGQPLDLVQMWVVPDENEVAPGYEQLELGPSDIQGRLAVVASGMRRRACWMRGTLLVLPQPESAASVLSNPARS